MKRKANSHRKAFLRISLGLMASLGFTLPAFAEGSQQLGIGTNGLNVYLFEYNATNGFIQANQGPRSLKVNVENANDVINISLCGWSYGGTTATRDDLAIEVFDPSGTEINYATQVAVTSPGSFSSTAAIGTTPSTLGTGAWLLTEGNARTATQPTLCNTQANPTQPVGVLTTPVRFKALTAGTYEIRLYNDSELSNSSNDVFTYFDVTVTPNTSTNPDPRANNGQLWATAWAFNAGNTFTAAGGYDADLYVRTPGGRIGTEFIWQLDLNAFAPQRHEIVANGIGLDAPNSRGSATAGAYTKSYPIYLSPPNSSSTVLPILSEPTSPNVTNVRFTDSAGIDNTISPAPTTSGVQDTGLFKFDTDVAGTYQIIIDTNNDGLFNAGDRVLFGSATSGANSVLWDGKDASGTVLTPGTYKAQVNVGLGEYHFVTYDSETSGGTSNGLSIWKYNGTIAPRSQITNYWDDTKVTTGAPASARNLVGGLSGTATGSHTWGDFTGNGIGNNNYIDTWVFGSPSTQTTKAIIATTDANDFGDAPDTYGTNKDIVVGGTPASHLINANLFLGTNVPDSETDGQPSVNADGDNANGTNDEDGVTFNALKTNATTYSVTVKVKNIVGAAASLGGWIDFNKDGKFQASEGAILAIPNNTNGTVTLTWTGLSGLAAGDTYARFRLNKDVLTTDDFIGGGTDGEVEDYKLTIGGIPNVALVKRISSILRGTAPAVEQIPALSFIDVTADLNDNAAGWPNQNATAKKDPTATPDTTNFSTLLGGVVNNTTAQPKDIVEYRIYFLSNGTANAQNVALCDFIPVNSSYVSGSTQLVLGATTTAISDVTGGTDTDGGFYPSPATVTYPTACTGTNNSTGAVLVNIGAVLQSTGAGTPIGSSGYILFKTKIN
jgi:uncharacterized repeat protein (TIGR01451 family)